LKPSSQTDRGSAHFLFYGGKGGVGKTTCAAARAVAESAAGARVLVVSTDPAHSLGDALAVRLSARPSRVPHGGKGSLHAAELDAPRAFTRWLSAHRAAMGEVLEHGTWLDRADIDALLDLPLPGVDELVGMMEIARLGSEPTSSARGSAASRGYDMVVVDTAPTGHTLRLLASPHTVAAVADILDALQHEHRLIRQRLARVGRPEAADRLIDLLAGQARDTGAVMRDPRRTTFHWVTLPEPLALAESVDAATALARTGIRIAEIVANRVLPDEGPCPVCDRRRADERRVMTAIRVRLQRGRHLRVIAASLEEPRGVDALGKIGRQLVGGSRPSRASASPAAARHEQPRAEAGHMNPPPHVSLPDDAQTVSAESIDVFRDVKLLFIGGKGGVGKTTVAAATALRLARADPRRRTLLLSTDPAHSLGDVFNLRTGVVGDRPRRLPGTPANLTVRELDADRALAARREDLQEALDDIASAFGAGEVAGHSAPAGMMNLAPPGIDELFGILSVVDARDEYDLIVVDTAPTGHALRLLELPDAAREWVQVLLRVLLKYRALVRPGRLAAELVDVSKAIRELTTMLRDASHTRFVVVTRAAVVPQLETGRLLERLRRLKLSVPAIVVNAVTLAPGRCRRCRATSVAERRTLAILRRRCASHRCAIIQAPLSAPAPRGAKALDRWGRRWIVEHG
jgi:arsenite/tail-anchored protein-transporting ATPase